MKPLDHKRIIERELEGVGIRLNKKPPAIVVTKKLKGGLNFSTSVKGGLTHLDEEGIRVILKEYSIVSANVRCNPNPNPNPNPKPKPKPNPNPNPNVGVCRRLAAPAALPRLLRVPRGPVRRLSPYP